MQIIRLVKVHYKRLSYIISLFDLIKAILSFPMLFAVLLPDTKDDRQCCQLPYRPSLFISVFLFMIRDSMFLVCLVEVTVQW